MVSLGIIIKTRAIANPLLLSVNPLETIISKFTLVHHLFHSLGSVSHRVAIHL